MHWVHCGDSRLYVVRDGALLTRTRDHSYMEQQAHMGRATEHINRNILFTCLGSPAKPVFDLSGPLSLQQGDRVLLCSDGLWGTVSDDEIAVELSPPCAGTFGARPGRDRPQAWRPALRQRHGAGHGVGDGRGLPELACLHRRCRGWFFRLHHPVGHTPDSTMDDLDDAAIERSIAEINAAIRRTAEKEFLSFSEDLPMTAVSRPGQRAADALRPVRITRGYTMHAEGSVLIEFGHTRVLCTASVEEKVPPHKRGSGEGWVTAEIRHAAACHPHPQRPRGCQGQAERPHPGNPATHRPLAALGVRPVQAGRTHHLPRLRRAAGRRRHPHRQHHRRLRGGGRCGGAPAVRRAHCRVADQGPCGRHLGRHPFRASHCSIWNTSRIRPATPT